MTREQYAKEKIVFTEKHIEECRQKLVDWVNARI